MERGRPKRFEEPVNLSFVCERREREWINKHHIDRLEVFRRGLKLTVPDDITAIEMEYTKARGRYLEQKQVTINLKKEADILREQLLELEKKKENIDKIKHILFIEWRDSVYKTPDRRPPWDDDPEICTWFADRDCPITFGEVVKIWDEVVV